MAKMKRQVTATITTHDIREIYFGRTGHWLDEPAAVKLLNEIDPERIVAEMLLEGRVLIARNMEHLPTYKKLTGGING